MIPDLILAAVRDPDAISMTKEVCPLMTLESVGDETGEDIERLLSRERYTGTAQTIEFQVSLFV